LEQNSEKKNLMVYQGIQAGPFQFRDQGTQAGPSQFRDQATQTEETRGPKHDMYLKTNIKMELLSQIADCLRHQFESWNQISERVFSCFIYMVLVYFGNTHYRLINKFLTKLNCKSVRTCRRWALTLVESCDDPTIILIDKRKNVKKSTFYMVYPEIERESREFALVECSKPKCSFNVDVLSRFVKSIVGS
jgi:hypothetical protein